MKRSVAAKVLIAFVLHLLVWAAGGLLVVRFEVFPLPLLVVLVALTVALAVTAGTWGEAHSALPSSKRLLRWLPVLFVLLVPPAACLSFLAPRIGLARPVAESGSPQVRPGEWLWYRPGVEGMRLVPGAPLLHQCPDGTVAFGRIFAAPGQEVRLLGRSLCVDGECFPQMPLVTAADQGDVVAAVEVTRDRFHIVTGPAALAAEVQGVDEVPAGWFVVLPDLRNGVIQSGCGPERPLVAIDEILGTPRHVVWSDLVSRIGSRVD